MRKLKILFASSEVHPLIKTGGLADVAGSLPQALQAAGLEVVVILPAYADAVAKAGALTPIAQLTVAGRTATLLAGYLPQTTVPVWLVDQADYFQRNGNPYHGPQGEWPDNPQRFAFFSQVVVAIAQNQAQLNWQPDLVHCNDWPTGLVPALLALSTPRPATVFTIHNLAYQGVYDRDRYHQLALPPELWHSEGLEFHNQFSFIKGGIAFADWVTTVSPHYAQEIRMPPLGYGLDGLLRHRGQRLSGILNGIDYQQWDPEQDPLLPAHFSVNDLSGKRANKAALQRGFGLAENPDIPLFAHIGRLVEQKGIDLLLRIMPDLHLHSQPLQVVILGSGDHYLEQKLQRAAVQYTDMLKIKIGYDEALAHQIEAGADFFLMPSRFEPCGLNQLYSLRYGTLPIVHNTGGLADTVVHSTRQTLADRTATGIVFAPAEPLALLNAINQALTLYLAPQSRQQLITTAMQQDFSWTHSAQEYIQLYQRCLPNG